MSDETRQAADHWPYACQCACHQMMNDAVRCPQAGVEQELAAAKAALAAARAEADERIAQADKFRDALRQIMQVLGPNAPDGLPEGADYEWARALRILRDAGIEYPAGLRQKGTP